MSCSLTHSWTQSSDQMLILAFTLEPCSRSCSPVKMDMAEAASAEGKCEGRRVSFCFCPCVCVCVLFPQSHTHTHAHIHIQQHLQVLQRKTNCTCPPESQWLKMQIRPGTPRGNTNVSAPNDGQNGKLGERADTGRRWMGGG